MPEKTSSVCAQIVHNWRWYLSLTDHRRRFANQLRTVANVWRAAQCRRQTQHNKHYVGLHVLSRCCIRLLFGAFIFWGLRKIHTHPSHTHLTQCIPRQITNNEVIKRYGREPFARRVPTVTRSQHNSHTHTHTPSAQELTRTDGAHTHTHTRRLQARFFIFLTHICH